MRQSVPVVVACLALGPQVIGQCGPQVAVAVSVLEQSAALDAVWILDTVQQIAACEVYGPFYGQIQTVSDLVFDTASQRNAQSDFRTFGFGDGYAGTYIYKVSAV